jgi:hypothetical protein
MCIALSLLNALFRNARMKDSKHAIFLRNNAKLVITISDEILSDKHLLNMLKTGEERLMRHFLICLLSVAFSDEDGIHPKILIMFADTAAQIFNPDNGNKAFELIIEHIKRHRDSMSGTCLEVLHATLSKSLGSLKRLAPLRQSSILRSSFISKKLISDLDLFD